MPAADEELIERAVIRMTPDAFEAFAATVSGLGTPVPQMVDLFKRKVPWESPAHQA